MVRRKFSINSCPEGSVIAHDVHNSQGTVIVTNGTLVNSYIKQKLKYLGIESLWINIPDKETGPDDFFSIFKEKYDINVMTLRRTFGELLVGKSIDRRKIKEICDSIYSDKDNSDEILNCLNMIKDMDEYTYTHSINVSIYSMLIAKWLNMPEDKIRNTIVAGMLHDIGKCKVPNDLLNKKGRLLPEEFQEIKRHTIYGYEILGNFGEIPEEIRIVTLMHHEREDGSGYPFAKQDQQIDMISKIVAVADVYDAMTTDRPYKKRMTPFDAFEELRFLGKNNLNYQILNLFLRNISTCYVGLEVIMNTGETGKIVYIPPRNISDPIVDIGTEYVDLSQNDGRKIVGII